MREKIKAFLQLLIIYRWRLTGIIAVALLLSFAWIGFTLRSLYQHNATIIQRHIEAKALSIPAGIYAAPRHLLPSQRLTHIEITERLLRAGYEEGMPTNDFATGNFFTIGNILEIHT